MKFKITIEKTKSIRPQWQLRIENVKTKLQVCVGHCNLEDKEGLERLNGFRARLELVLNS